MVVYVVYKRYDNFDGDRDDYAVKAVYTNQEAAEQYVNDHEYTKFVAMQVLDNYYTDTPKREVGFYNKFPTEVESVRWQDFKNRSVTND